MRWWENDGSGVDSVMYLEPSNYKNMGNSYSLENYVEIYAH